MAGQKLGKLADFNYGKNIKDRLKPLNDLLGALQNVSGLVAKLSDVLKEPHRAIPYGTKLDAFVLPISLYVPEVVPTIRGCCEGLHEKIMDPVLEIADGVGQVISILQKIVIEVPMMGQQAFAGFVNQVQNGAAQAATNAVGNIDIADPNLSGLPINTPGIATLNVKALPNYTTGQEIGQMAGIDAGQIVKDAGEAVMQLLISLAEQELVKFIMEQLTALTLEIAAAITATTAAAAGPQAPIAVPAAKAACALIFEGIKRTVLKQIERQLDKISSFKTKAGGDLIGAICQGIPVFRDNPLLKELKLDQLLQSVFTAALQNQDVSADVDAWMQNLATSMTQHLQDAVQDGAGLDSLGGVLKGYVLRHRFRNLVEFDGANGLGQGNSSDADNNGVGSIDGFNNWRNTFDRVFKPSLWKAKATWVVQNRTEFEALVARYFEGNYTGQDRSGDGSSAWQGSSYATNAGYGLSGVVFYNGTDDLTLNFTGARQFIGKCVLYAPNAKVIVDGCKMRDNTKDWFTLICGKNVKLPPNDVEISVCAIGNGDDCKVEFADSTKILGSLTLKRYRDQDQNDGHATLNGELTYHDRLNASGGDAFGSIKSSHLFVSVSPFVISKDLETQP